MVLISSSPPLQFRLPPSPMGPSSASHGTGISAGRRGRLARWVGARDCPPPLTGRPTMRRTLGALAAWTALGPALIPVPVLYNPTMGGTHLLAVGLCPDECEIAEIASGVGRGAGALGARGAKKRRPRP